MTPTFHDLTISKALEVLKSSQSGLTQGEAVRRLAEHGENNLPEESATSWGKILARQFLNPLMLILFAAMFVSAVFKDFVDGVMIGAAVVINVAVGFAQEFKANRALTRLRSFMVQYARVLRDGRQVEIVASEIVPGDVLVISAGDRIAADARVVSADAFEVDEAILTGESMPIEKTTTTLSTETSLADRTNMVHSGTLVTRGRARALVCATGSDTEFGRIAEMISKTETDRSPLQEQLARFSKFLALLYSAVALVIFIVGLLLGKSLFEMFILSVALAVAAVPEGLMVTVTIVLAFGMQRMLKHKALVRRLVATETLGMVSVICTDKTGTITQATMKVSSLVTADAVLQNTDVDLRDEESVRRAAFICLLCNDSDGRNSLGANIGSPTDVALLAFGERIGYVKELEEKKFPRVATLPFDSKHKFMLTLVGSSGGGREILAKGAVEIILSKSTKVLRGMVEAAFDDETRSRLAREAEVMTSRGLRVIGLAYKSAPQNRESLSLDDLSDMTLVGLIGLHDPVRDSAKETIASAARAGVRTVIVTGDHPRTAQAVAAEVGIGGDKPRVCTGRELDEMSDDDLEKSVEFYDIFARIESAHKVRIVNAWRARGATVAMTGDGVNDAPALKAADIGVAQGSGTDVAKRVADMVLLDNNLETIVSAIKEGRVIFENIRKITIYLLIHGFAEMNLILLSLIFGLPLPIIAAQILYINFVTDGLPAIALTVDQSDDEIMRQPPRKRGTPILTARLKWFVFGFGSLLNLLPFALYAYLVASGHDVSYSRTIMFVVLSLETIIIVFSVRSYQNLLFRSHSTKNSALLVAICSSFALTCLAVYWKPIQNLLSLVPLDLNDWLLLSIILVAKFIIIEFYKYIFMSRKRSVNINYAQAS